MSGKELLYKLPLPRDLINYVILYLKVIPRDSTDLKRIVQKYIKNNNDAIDIAFVDVSGISSFRRLFFMTPFNGWISDWDMSNAVNLDMTFYGCKRFNQRLKWKLPNVVSMKLTFAHTNYNQPLGDLNPVKLENMTLTFINSKYNHPLPWYLPNLKYMYRTFYKSAFNHSIESWKPRNNVRCELTFFKYAMTDIPSWLGGYSGKKGLSGKKIKKQTQ
jgi:hypothetical protein